MKLSKKNIGQYLKLSPTGVVIDEAFYDHDYPDEIKLYKLLRRKDKDFSGHISDYAIYPDYAISKIINQGLRLLIAILYPDLIGVPVGMIEHTKLRAQLYPNDSITVYVRKWQE